MDFHSFLEKEIASENSFLARTLEDLPRIKASAEARDGEPYDLDFARQTYTEMHAENIERLEKMRTRYALLSEKTPYVKKEIDQAIALLFEIEAIDEKRPEGEDRWNENLVDDIENLLESPRSTAILIQTRYDLATGKKRLSDVLREAGLKQTGAHPSHIPGHVTKIFESP